MMYVNRALDDIKSKVQDMKDGLDTKVEALDVWIQSSSKNLI